MGYESRIFVIERKVLNDFGYTIGSEIARFDLCKMGYDKVNGIEFREVFKTPIDFNIYSGWEDPDKEYDEEDYRVDLYGEHCKYAPVDDVINWIEEHMKSDGYEYYRREALFLDFIKSLKEHKDDYSELVLVHFGC